MPSAHRRLGIRSKEDSVTQAITNVRLRTEFGREVERHIEMRTSGRVRQVRVETGEDRIVVRGTAPSYYLKQLVMQAVLESMPESKCLPVRLDMEVASPAITMEKSAVPVGAAAEC